MSGTSRIDKVIEIVRRQHDNISDEHMIDILAIADQAVAELAQLRDKLQEWDDYGKAALDERCTDDQHHCGCVAVYRKELAELRAALDKAKKALNNIWEWAGEEEEGYSERILGDICGECKEYFDLFPEETK